MEVTDEHRELLNPTTGDVKMGAILDQCVSKKAERKISKWRLDMVQGNVNRYDSIMNGAVQLEKVQTYTQLAASMATLNEEREEQNVQSRMQKKH